MKNAGVLLLLGCWSLGCAPAGLVLHPTSANVYAGSRDYHFVNEIVGFDFYFIKSDEELMMPDQTAIFVENRTSFPMKLILSRENQKVLVRETVPPFGQDVFSIVLPYGEWLRMSLTTDKNYTARIRLELK